MEESDDGGGFLIPSDDSASNSTDSEVVPDFVKIILLVVAVGLIGVVLLAFYIR